jgi:hypothetical protein
MVISAVIFGQFFIFNKKIEREQKIFWGLDVLILAEMAGLFFLLPLNYNILGFLVAIIFYLLVLINDWRQTNRLNFKNLKWPIILASLITLLILLTARWL